MSDLSSLSNFSSSSGSDFSHISSSSSSSSDTDTSSTLSDSSSLTSSSSSSSSSSSGSSSHHTSVDSIEEGRRGEAKEEERAQNSEGDHHSEHIEEKTESEQEKSAPISQEHLEQPENSQASELRSEGKESENVELPLVEDKPSNTSSSNESVSSSSSSSKKSEPKELEPELVETPEEHFIKEDEILSHHDKPKEEMDEIQSSKPNSASSDSTTTDDLSPLTTDGDTSTGDLSSLADSTSTTTSTSSSSSSKSDKSISKSLSSETEEENPTVTPEVQEPIISPEQPVEQELQPTEKSNEAKEDEQPQEISANTSSSDSESNPNGDTNGDVDEECDRDVPIATSTDVSDSSNTDSTSTTTTSSTTPSSSSSSSSSSEHQHVTSELLPPITTIPELSKETELEEYSELKEHEPTQEEILQSELEHTQKENGFLNTKLSQITEELSRYKSEHAILRGQIQSLRESVKMLSTKQPETSPPPPPASRLRTTKTSPKQPRTGVRTSTTPSSQSTPKSRLAQPRTRSSASSGPSVYGTPSTNERIVRLQNQIKSLQYDLSTSEKRCRELEDRLLDNEAEHKRVVDTLKADLRYMKVSSRPSGGEGVYALQQRRMEVEKERMEKKNQADIEALRRDVRFLATAISKRIEKWFKKTAPKIRGSDADILIAQGSGVFALLDYFSSEEIAHILVSEGLLDHKLKLLYDEEVQKAEKEYAELYASLDEKAAADTPDNYAGGAGRAKSRRYIVSSNDKRPHYLMGTESTRRDVKPPGSGRERLAEISRRRRAQANAQRVAEERRLKTMWGGKLPPSSTADDDSEDVARSTPRQRPVRETKPIPIQEEEVFEVPLSPQAEEDKDFHFDESSDPNISNHDYSSSSKLSTHVHKVDDVSAMFASEKETDDSFGLSSSSSSSSSSKDKGTGSNSSKSFQQVVDDIITDVEDDMAPENLAIALPNIPLPVVHTN